MLVLLNFSDEVIDVRLSVQGAASSFFDGGELRDLLANQYIPTPSGGSLRLKPFDARVLSRAKPPSEEPCSA